MARSIRNFWASFERLQRLLRRLRDDGQNDRQRDGDEGEEFGGGDFKGMWARGFLSDLGPMPNANGRIGERKALQKNAGTMSTKRIFTMVMPGKIIA